MTEHVAPHLPAEEASRIIIADIKAYPKDGSDKREEHIRLFGELVAPEEINALWAERYKELRAPEKVTPFVRRITGKNLHAPAQAQSKPIIVSGTGDWASLTIPPNATKLERLTYVPGIVGNITEWIVRTAKRPNRMMALGTALCVVGTLIGRRIQGPTGSATHLYIVILAPSGYGKDHPLWCGKTTLTAIKASHLIGPDEFASSPGFTKRLVENPLLVCFVDEFGDELDKIKTQGNNAFVKSVIGLLKKCYNAWETVNTAAKVHEPSVTILWPAPSLVAAATPERFFGTLTSQDFESGFINRFLILPFESFRRPPEQLVLATEPPKELIAALKALPQAENSILDRKIDEIDKPVRLEVGWADPSAAELYLAFSRKMDFAESGERRRYELGMRAAEHAIRLATNIAVGRGLRVIEREDMAWAIALAEQSFDAAVGGAEKYMREYLEFPRFCDRVAEAFRLQKFISKPKLFRDFGRTQRWGNELGRVIEQLAREKRIQSAEQTPTNGGHEMEGWEWIGE